MKDKELKCFVPLTMEWVTKNGLIKNKSTPDNYFNQLPDNYFNQLINTFDKNMFLLKDEYDNKNIYRKGGLIGMEKDNFKDYSYKKDIKYDDKGNKTQVMTTTLTGMNLLTISISEPKNTADQYSGFAIAYAMLMAGGSKEFNKIADYYINKKPKIDKRNEEKAEKLHKELAAKNERILKKQEKNRIKKAAREMKEKYEAAKLASEKYGVPMEFSLKMKGSN